MKTNPAFVAVFLIAVALLVANCHATVNHVISGEKGITFAFVILITAMVGMTVVSTKK